jgi:hypothetical protein
MRGACERAASRQKAPHQKNVTPAPAAGPSAALTPQGEGYVAGDRGEPMRPRDGSYILGYQAGTLARYLRLVHAAEQAVVVA